jgi:hypothetical protein
MLVPTLQGGSHRFYLKQTKSSSFQVCLSGFDAKRGSPDFEDLARRTELLALFGRRKQIGVPLAKAMVLESIRDHVLF